MPQDTDIVVSQLPSASAVNASDLVMLTQENAQAETGYDTKKGTFENVAKKVVNGIEYETLLADFPQGKRNPTDALNELRDMVIGQFPIKTASGSIVTFDTSLALPLVSLKANITAQQAGTGTPSPQNIRSISGFSSVRLWNTQYAEYFKGLLLGTYAFAELGDLYWAIGSGGATRFVSTIASQPPKSSGNIICDCYQTTTNTAIYAGSVDDAIALHTTGAIWVRDTDYETADAFKTAMDGRFAIYELATPTTPTITTEQFNTLCQAFGISGEAITISLGETYYGGVIDVKNGTLTIDKKIIDLGDYTFTYNSTYERMSTTLSDLKAVGTVRATPFICSCFQSIDDGRTMQEVPYDSVYAGGAGTTLVYIKTQTTDPDAFKTAVTGQKLVYPIEPITLTGLTPDNFTTIAGENNIFADSGGVELSFKQGIQEYIDEQIASVQALVL